MYIFEMKKLQAGDILLTAQDAFSSKAIRKAIRSDFSHAMLYVGRGSYIHSDRDGVHSGNIQRLLLSKPEHGIVLRAKCENENIAKEACKFARSQIGKSYSINGAIRAKIKGTPLSRTQQNRQFCSRLVAQAYDYAKLEITSEPLFCTPADILESVSLGLIPTCVRPATEDEIAFANSENILQNQSLATNQFLINVRNISKEDIQSFEQIPDHLLRHPKNDQKISAVLKSSGYLELWQYDLQKNPWRYNGEMFYSLPISKEKALESAKFELESANEMIEQFTTLRNQYLELYSYAKLDYFTLNIDLYNTLIEIHSQRKNASLYVLRNT